MEGVMKHKILIPVVVAAAIFMIVVLAFLLFPPQRAGKLEIVGVGIAPLAGASTSTNYSVQAGPAIWILPRE